MPQPREIKSIELDPTLLTSVQAFRLPRFSEITNVGLYLEQVTRFVNTYLAQVGCDELTASMISNYVKQRTIPRPIKKAYNAESIAHLLVVGVLKNVASMEDIRLLLEIQRSICPAMEAYDSFCDEFESILRAVFGLDEMPLPPAPASASRTLLRTAILAAAQQLYLDNVLRALRR